MTTRYFIAIATLIISVALYGLLRGSKPRNEQNQAHFYLYSQSAPQTPQGYMTNTNYIQVNMEEYKPLHSYPTVEYGIVTLSETTVPGRKEKFPDFSPGKITFTKSTGFPNGGIDFVVNDPTP